MAYLASFPLADFLPDIPTSDVIRARVNKLTSEVEFIIAGDAPPEPAPLASPRSAEAPMTRTPPPAGLSLDVSDRIHNA